MVKTQTYGPRGESFSALEESLGKGNISPLYLIHGNEQLLVDRALDLITTHALGPEKDRLNFQIFSAEDSSPRDIVLAAMAYPMMAGRRVVVVRDIDKLSDTGRLTEYVSDPNPSTVMLLTCVKADFRQKLFQELRKTAFMLDCRTPFDNRIPGWIETEVKRAGKSITPEAAELIHLSAGTSLSEMGNELEKLYLYVGKKRTIDVDDVAAVVGTSRSYSIYDLQRAIGVRDTGRALEILMRMIDHGENMTGVVARLTWYFEKLWLLPDRPGQPRDIASLLGIREYFAREYATARRHYSTEEITGCFLALREADLRLKTSGSTNRLIMTLLLHTIMRPQAPKLNELVDFQ